MKKWLRNFQDDIADYIIAHPRCGVFVPMGMGKTVSALTAVVRLRMLGEYTGKVLVVAPLRVAKTTWPDEVRDWEHLSHLRVSTIIGEPDERRAALRRDADVYTINYDNLQWLEKNLTGVWPFGWVIADEATKLKGFRTRQGTARAKVLGKVAHSRIERITLLTGTPAPNGVKDLWALGWFIDRGRRLGDSFKAFTDRWFRRDFTGFNYEPLPHAQAQIEAELKDCCFSLDVRDYFDIKEPIVAIRKVKLSPTVMRQYKKLEREMMTELKDVFSGKTNRIEAANAATKTMKCLQMANGAAYIGDGSMAWTNVHDEKLDELESIVEEAMGAPILVAYHFKSDLARLKKRFPQGRELDKNAQTIKDWNAGKIPLLFAHPASAGHGLSLQHGGNIIVFFSVNWNLEEHDQIKERIGPTRQLQSGYDRPVYVYYILADRTIDEVVLERLETKGEVQSLLMKALKRSEGNE